MQRVSLKSGVRSIGIDDGPFSRDRRGNVLVVGAVYRGGSIFDGLVTTRIRKDGFNATDKLLAMLGGSKFLEQLHYILLDGIALGGFNIVDIEKLHKETGRKVLVAVRKKPDLDSIRNAIANLTQPKRRMRRIERAGEIHKMGKIYCQFKGMDKGEVNALLDLTCTRSLLPEPIRAAHLIAGGVVRGQSGNRA